MDKTSAIVNSIARIYSWIDSEIGDEQTCEACGKCCNFETFGHKLFITTPEIIYFKSKFKPEDLKPMTTGICPYNALGKCTVYEVRFAACRIFSCKTDTEAQNDLTEDTLKELKGLCDTFDIPYRYVDLKTALNARIKP